MEGEGRKERKRLHLVILIYMQKTKNSHFCHIYLITVMIRSFHVLLHYEFITVILLPYPTRVLFDQFILKHFIWDRSAHFCPVKAPLRTGGVLFRFSAEGIFLIWGRNRITLIKTNFRRCINHYAYTVRVTQFAIVSIQALAKCYCDIFSSMCSKYSDHFVPQVCDFLSVRDFAYPTSRHTM